MNRRCPLLCVTLMIATSVAVAGEKPRPDQPKEFTYKKTEQADLKILVHFPKDWTPQDKRPAIVFFFGGGWQSGNVRQFERQATYLAQRGMVTARADYRVKSRHNVMPDKCVEDAKSAVRWLRQHAEELGIDPDRIVSSGGSAGAHIAACTSLTPGLEAAGEDHAVSSQPNALVLFNPVLKLAGEERLLDRVGGDEKLAEQISPTLHLKKSAPPTLLLYGTDDALIEQGREFLEKSKDLGHRCELYTAEGERHGFFNRSPWQERTLHRVDEFLATLGYLKGKPTIDVPEK